MTVFSRAFRSPLRAAIVLLALPAAATAATITLATDPFADSDALTTPGRQIVGGELFEPFSPATDQFVLDPAAFGVSDLRFANGLVGDLPADSNVIVLQTFDHDGDPTTPFLAGIAANIIADQITTSGPGFFIYFNSNLDLPRLVFSTDLSDNTADLKVLVRLTNLTGDDGRDAMATFTAGNFRLAAVPDSGGALTLLFAAGALLVGRWATRRRGARRLM